MSETINNHKDSGFIDPKDNAAYEQILHDFQQALTNHTNGSMVSYGMDIIEKLSVKTIDYIFGPVTDNCAVIPTRVNKVMQTLMHLKSIMSCLAKKAVVDLSNDGYDYAITEALKGGLEIPGYKISITPVGLTTNDAKPVDSVKDFLNNIEKKESPSDDLTDSTLAKFFRYIDASELYLGREVIKFINELITQKIDAKENKYTFALDLIEGVVEYYITKLLADGVVEKSPEDFSSNLLDAILSIKLMLENALTDAKEMLGDDSYHKLLSDLITVDINIPNYIVSVHRKADGDNSVNPSTIPSSSNSISEVETPTTGCGGYSCESCWDDICKICHSSSGSSDVSNSNIADTQSILSSKWDNIKTIHDANNILSDMKARSRPKYQVESVRVNLLTAENKKLSKKLKKLKRKNKKLKKKLNGLYGR